MLLLQARGDEIIGFFIGVLIVAGIFSLLGGIFIRLAVKPIDNKLVKFSKAFWTSFVAISITFIFDKILQSFAKQSTDSRLDVLPAVIFFVLI